MGGLECNKLLLRRMKERLLLVVDCLAEGIPSSALIGGSSDRRRWRTNCSEDEYDDAGGEAFTMVVVGGRRKGRMFGLVWCGNINLVARAISMNKQQSLCRCA